MATEIEIFEWLDLKEPEIYLEKKEFSVSITKEQIEITCEWDYGYDGRGKERVTVPTELIKSLIEKINSKALNP